MAQLTAVKWLSKELTKVYNKEGRLKLSSVIPLFLIAEKMEKQQIIDARDSTASELMKNMEDVWIYGKAEYKTRTPEEYYIDTYVGQGSPDTTSPNTQNK